ncbi:MAG: thiol oxidoreductase [Proteobacteria bacterium]|nr:thiol oxidoreductase [Pseudomonadota bacterium]
MFLRFLAHRSRFWVVAAFLVATPGIAAAADAASGGATTRTVANGNAFSSPARNLPPQWRQRFFDGNQIFNAPWAAPPNADTPFVGLGLTFNAVSCAGCHPRDGRGAPPVNAGDAMTSMLVRISIAGTSETGGPLAHPSLGLQINDKSVAGVPSEGAVGVSYHEVAGRYGDGAPFSLRQPRYDYSPPDGLTSDDAILMSPRVAPAVFGLGLLEAIAESDIVARADPDDRDRDGISGRANRVWDATAGAARLGRFGWKANVGSLRDQNAGAFLGDMGITTDVFPTENCPPAQRDCLRIAARTSGVEADAQRLDDLTFYMESVAVPARRRVDDPVVGRGEALFSQIGCAACHTPHVVTGDHANRIVAGQTIQPFTDLLLHDMGDDLADGRPDFLASGAEWRTPPLWGLGLIETVNGHAFLLHDGRARGIAEAILWHGGEAADARERFRTLPADSREDLITFLRSL